jgi:hypothetical protein
MKNDTEIIDLLKDAVAYYDRLKDALHAKYVIAPRLKWEEYTAAIGRHVDTLVSGWPEIDNRVSAFVHDPDDKWRRSYDRMIEFDELCEVILCIRVMCASYRVHLP